MPLFFRTNGLAFLLFFLPLLVESQSCDFTPDKRAKSQYSQAMLYLSKGQISPASSALSELIQNYPLFAKAYLSYGILILQDYYSETSQAERYFNKALEICSDSSHLAYLYLGKIHFGQHNFVKTIEDLEHFLAKPELVNRKDLNEAENYLAYAKTSAELIAKPVPFEPKKVAGISSQYDEYLPIISPDNEFALYTRRSSVILERGFNTEYTQVEKFTYSLRNKDGSFDAGTPMPFPFNQTPNEGAPTLTIDNNDLYYTLCTLDPKTNYLNCDLMHSHFNGKRWSEPSSLGNNINGKNTWESQPSINAAGNILYFSSNREGGFGGYDLYKIEKLPNGKWSDPINLGEKINTSGHEKSPFIHSDSQTLYFSSDGISGLGGFDIFYTRINSLGQFDTPKNIGYPINSFEDDLGFFVSTDGFYGYYASNRFDENRSWNLYHFPLYERAKPQKVLFIKGEVKNESNQHPIRAKVEIKNLNNRTIKEIPVDSVSGKYVAVLLFKSDQLLTVRKEGFVYESKYIGSNDSTFARPSIVDLQIKPIEVGQSYKINDVYFDFNSADLTNNSFKVIQEFADFLQTNLNLQIEIQGHTDAIGSDQANMELSEQRAATVYTTLIDLGISASRLTYKGFGEQVPITSNETEEGRSQNRRTVFLIVA
ncbi:MAG: OmpA family protein, partial [Bacteroidales bacterium]|nr:OmpA family protein [Bacteroidales bacterium]